MTDSVVHVTMREWETREPTPGSALEGCTLRSGREHALAVALGKSGLLKATELRAGLMLQSFSHVGKVRLGDVEITVRPKLNATSLLRLLRYAYGFRRLKLLPEAAHRLDQAGFQDLLVSQLNAEVSELVARGLHRAYVPRKDWLASPRGRIDIGRLAAQGGILTATLPCTHHPRIEDALLNQILRAGLELAGTVAGDLMLRREARGLAAVFEEQVSRLQLHAGVLDRGSGLVNRLTAAYEPALKIISLLWDAQGVALEGAGTEQKLPGFLFDMNRFFQSLLSRFLRENLPEHAVREEFRLRGMIQFVPGFNPRRRPPTIPRPDVVIFRGARQVAILDAKYRDLWETKLPRNWLYQLAIYAASHEQRSAAMLYPTTDAAAKEARIAVTDPVHGRPMALVCLRPVHLDRLKGLVLQDHSVSVERERREYAERLAFGPSSA